MSSPPPTSSCAAFRVSDIASQVAISRASMVRVETCSARASTPPSGIIVRLSQARMFSVQSTSLIRAMRDWKSA